MKNIKYIVMLAAIFLPSTFLMGQGAPGCIPTINFTDNGDGTVTDITTGLMWQQEDDDTERDWDDAIAYCDGLDLAGHVDWRLPDIHELWSIVDLERILPAIDETYFPGTLKENEIDSLYWSSSTCAENHTRAYFVSLGCDVKATYLEKTYEHGIYVRCVR
ncbi:DUF1566 domain-containing protein [Thermodesulfobacteriota bacterium]